MANESMAGEENRDRISLSGSEHGISNFDPKNAGFTGLDPTDLYPTDQASRDPEPTGLEPELGGYLRDSLERTGLEPELGGLVRQNGVYVDEATCIGCRHCAHVARNTFYMEPDHGRSRVLQQDGDSEEVIQEAIDTCPVDCIHWVDYTQLKQLEQKRKTQVIKPLGLPQPSVKLN